LYYLLELDNGEGVFEGFWSKFRCLRLFCPSL